MIQFVKHGEIDIRKWDECVKQSPGGFPYAYSWWLDIVCREWAALILDDFTAVMPLPIGRKFGYSYIFQPYFTQQLGIYSGKKVTAELTDSFLEAIPRKYRYARIHLNFNNNLPGRNYNFATRRNYQLLLSSEPIILSGNYRRNCRRNIQKAKLAGLVVKPGPGPVAFALFIERHLDQQLGRVPHSIYPALATLIQTSREHLTSEISGVYDNRGELVAAGWFVITTERCMFMVCASTRKGKDEKAMYLLVDDMIQKQAGSNKVFDFTGSNLPGVSYFDTGFGAGETFYPSWVRNTLPWPLRLLKK